MTYFDLSTNDKKDVLEEAGGILDQAPNLLEKDIWVVWALNVLFDSHFGKDLVFKGGTSLSKAYQFIYRFSEDIDLSYNIRKIIPDLIKNLEYPFPTTRSQASKWTKAVWERLPDWIQSNVIPVLSREINRNYMNAKLVQEDHVLFLEYEPMQESTGYVLPKVMLEFGARSTGMPAGYHEVACDIAAAVPNLEMPTARPLVMYAERTFLDKALAAHVYCLRDKFRGREHYARHWYDLDCLDRNFISQNAIMDRQLIQDVVRDKHYFYRESDRDGNVIDYQSAMSGGIRLVPTGEARDALADDYLEMHNAEIIQSKQVPFDILMRRLSNLENRMNTTLGKIPDKDDKSVELNVDSGLDDPSA